MLKKRRTNAFILPFALVFCMIQLALLLLIHTSTVQQGLSFAYSKRSQSLMAMEKASRKLVIDLIAEIGHIDTYHFIAQQSCYYWDLSADGKWDAVTIFSGINLKSAEIEWVSAHYLLKEAQADLPNLPLFDTRLSTTSSRRVKMVPHGHVVDVKALYKYIYHVTHNTLKTEKISIPVNENP